MERKQTDTLPVVLLAISVAALAASLLLLSLGFFFFFFLLPVTLYIPWSIKRLVKRRHV